MAGRGGVPRYVAQASSQFDPGGIGFARVPLQDTSRQAFHRAGAEIAAKGHLWMETTEGLDTVI
jgi:hypothetical protein